MKSRLFFILSVAMPIVLFPTLAAGLVINEIDYDQMGSDAAEFIELFNDSLSDIDLNGYSVELVNGSIGVKYQEFILPSHNLAVGEYFVICGMPDNVPNCDLDVAPDTNLVQNGAPDAVALWNGAILIDTVSYEGSTASPYTETTGTSTSDSSGIDMVSIGRFPDGNDTDNNDKDFALQCITPGQANTAFHEGCEHLPIATATPGQVAFTEFMAKPGDPLTEENGEWIELTNLTSQWLALADLIFCDADDISCLALPNDMVMEPHGILVFARSANLEVNGGIENVDFVYDFALNHFGDILRLQDDWPTKVPVNMIDEVNFDSWTIPEAAAMQLDIDQYEGDNNLSENWCPATDEYSVDGPHYGTPGELNSSCLIEPDGDDDGDITEDGDSTIDGDEMSDGDTITDGDGPVDGDTITDGDEPVDGDTVTDGDEGVEDGDIMTDGDDQPDGDVMIDGDEMTDGDVVMDGDEPVEDGDEPVEDGDEPVEDGDEAMTDGDDPAAGGNACDKECDCDGCRQMSTAPTWWLLLMAWGLVMLRRRVW